jgi:hypothetical protein
VISTPPRFTHAPLEGAHVPTNRALGHASLAGVALDRGRAAEALAHARAGMAILGAIGALEEMEIVLLLVHAEALEASGLTDEARDAVLGARDRVCARARHVPAAYADAFLSAPFHAGVLALAERLCPPIG